MSLVKMKRVIGLVILLTIAGSIGSVRTGDSPLCESFFLARRMSDLVLGEMPAALSRELSIAPHEIAEGRRAISLIFDDAERNEQLLDLLLPSRDECRSSGQQLLALNSRANRSAAGDYERWFHRITVSLSSPLHQACVLSHANLTGHFLSQTNKQ